MTDHHPAEHLFCLCLFPFSHQPGRNVRGTDREKVVDGKLDEMQRAQDVDPRERCFPDKAGNEQTVVQRPEDLRENVGQDRGKDEF